MHSAASNQKSSSSNLHVKRKRARPAKADRELFDALKPGAMPMPEYRTVLRLQWRLAQDFKLACKERNMSFNHAVETLVDSWVRHLQGDNEEAQAASSKPTKKSKRKAPPTTKRKKD